MSQSTVYILLLCALALPVLGALVLRILAHQLSAAQLYGAAGAILGIALISLFVLARSDVPNLQLGGVSILLPVAAPEDSDLPVAVVEPTSVPPAETSPAGVTPAATTQPAATGTSAPAATSIPTTEPPTAAPTEVPTPTAAPTPAPEPTAAPTEAPAPPAARRTYTVQSGDTLRSIAEQFDVSVQALIDANQLTAEQADSLRVGQELVIP